MTCAVIGLGSNLDDPKQQLSQALQRLRDHPQIENLRASDFVRSAPLGGMRQPDYCNAVAAFQTELSALALLRLLQSVEREQGRRRVAERWSARPLDLDLLVFGHEIHRTAELTVPHPAITQRSFVIQPWLQLDSSARLPDGTELSRLAAARVKELSFWDQPELLFRIM